MTAATRLVTRRLSSVGFTGCGKTHNAVILSEAKNLSLFVLLYVNRREILRFAQNDKTRHCFRNVFSLWVFVLARTNPRRPKPALLKTGSGRQAEKKFYGIRSTRRAPRRQNLRVTSRSVPLEFHCFRHRCVGRGYPSTSGRSGIRSYSRSRRATARTHPRCGTGTQ